MYEQYFGLNSRPFSITSDPSFLFFSQKHQEAFDALLYGINARLGFIEITGEIGSGKTTLCRALLSRLPSSVKSAYIFNSSLSEIQFLQTFMSDLGLDTHKKNRHRLFSELNDFLIDQLAKNGNVVLIIDEAQNLSVRLLEQIRMLSNLETDKEKLLQIVLVGQPELRDKLNLPSLKQLRQRISVRYHIKALSENEIQEYIRHRLQIAGMRSPETLFERSAISAVYHHSQGIPRVINLLCDKILLTAFARNQQQISEEIVLTAIQELEGVLV